jgi:thiamine kinase-like enzyme
MNYVRSLENNAFLESILPEQIQLTYSHGDFTPWNTSVFKEELYVIDWELFGKRPLGYDIFHFHVQPLIMNTAYDASTIYTHVARELEPLYDSKYFGDLTFLQSFLLYISVIKSDYSVTYTDEIKLHWQALRAIEIWNNLMRIIYEKIR